MKKITRIAALLAAGALLFGAFGCSSGGDGDETPQGPQTETVSYALKTGTLGFESGTLKVSGMNTTEDTSDDTFEMTLKPTGKDAVTVTGTWKLNDGSTTEFTCKSDKSVEINGVSVTPDTVVTGTMNSDTISLSIPTETTPVTLTFVKNEDTSGGTGGATSATVKYLQLTNTGNSSNVTPDWSATVSETSLVTATDLVWKLATGLTAKQFDIKINNNNVDVAHLEQQWTGDYAAASNGNALASVSFTITAVKALKLKTISAVTESGKGPNGMTCWIGDEQVATGVQYSDAAVKAFKLSNVSLDDYEVAAGDTVTIKITCDKTGDTSGTDSSTGKVGFGQISLAVEAAGTTGGIQGGGQQGGGDNTGNTGNTGDNTGNTGDNTGNTGDNSGNTGDNSGNTGNDSGNTGNGNENQGGGNNESGDQGGGGNGDGEEEEPEEVPPTVGVKLDADFTKFSAATVCAEGSTVPVRLGDTDFFAVSGSSGKAITLEKKNNSMALVFSGGGGVEKSAVFFYAKKGTATVTVTYYNGNEGRYVKVLNAGMDTTEATDDEKTDKNNTPKTREINITIDEDLTPVYIGSASSGIYVASIKVEYTDE